MPTHRREFLVGAGAAATLASLPHVSFAVSSVRMEATLFDAFTIFDPRPIGVLIAKIFPDKSAQLEELWRTRQFEYCWLRSLANQYRDFWQITESALVDSMQTLKINLSVEHRNRLMNAFLNLKPWPDVFAALKALTSAGVRLGICQTSQRTCCSRASRLLDFTVRSNTCLAPIK